MVSQKVTIKNPTGLHLRPAGVLCKKAMQYRADHLYLCGDHSQRQERLKRIGRLREIGRRDRSFLQRTR